MIQGLDWWELPLGTIALAPHIIVETLAYVLASMAGIFLSRGATRYSWFSLRFRNVGKAVLYLVAAGIIAVVVAAFSNPSGPIHSSSSSLKMPAPQANYTGRT